MPARLAPLIVVGLLLPAAAVAQPRTPDGSTDSLVSAAARAIEGGRPWQATRLLAPLTREAAANPALALTAARAAAEWEGWTTVTRLLLGATWLDRVDGGAGRALLGRALLERGNPTAAVRETRRASELASDPTRGERILIHARALDRLDLLDSAAAGYRTAAEALPLIADWLWLRAAGVTRDSAERATLYQRIETAPARARVPWTEALARDRGGDWRGAADRYTSLGARLAAVRLRLTQGDDSTRAATRADLATLLATSLSPGDAGDAIALFDRHFPRRTAADELRIARRGAAAGLLERAARGFAAARGMLTDRDRFTYATVLARLGRGAEAVPLFDGVRAPDLRGDAAYQQARLLLRTGQRDEALRALRAIPERFPADSEPAATALFLIGDLAADRGDDSTARRAFVEAATRYPTTPFGRRAAIQAAMIAYLDGDFETATTEFDRIAATVPGEEGLGGRYWAGRALLARGDTAAARARWAALVDPPRESYYAWLAAKRLSGGFRTFAARGDSASPDSLPTPLARARLLGRLGLRVEERFELEAFAAQGAGSTDRILDVAEDLAAGSWHARALRVAQRSLDRGAGLDRRVAELLYPLPFAELLRHEAEGAGVDPMLVAGLIRQESLFDPEARSVADARGLMQVLPSVGEELARKASLPEWDAVLLYQPDVNLDFGIDHLADGLRRLTWPERALAAYNAGVDRVERWQAIRGVTDDPEVFVERIPFVETRDYVRKVLRNFAIYAALYLAPTS